MGLNCVRAVTLVLFGLMLAPGTQARAQEAQRETEALVEASARRMLATREHRAHPAPKPVAKIAAKPAKKPAPAVLPEAPVGPKQYGENTIAAALEHGGSSPWAIVVGLTLLTLLPSILLSMTPMVRLLVVFHFLRQALGTQTAPSNQVLMGLALVMTWFLMQPVLLQVDHEALTPYRAGTISASEAFERGSIPVKTYLLKYAREKDLAIFARAAGNSQPKNSADLSMAMIVPAYMLSELKAGFQIGAVLFLPFLLVDFLVASITTSIGMMQLSPVVISTPVKILLFVMVDGWSLLADQLLKSF